MNRYLYVFGASALALVSSVPSAFAQASALGNSFAIYNAAARGSAVAYDSRNHVYLVVSAYGGVNGRFVSADGAPLSNCVSSGSSFVMGGGAFGHFPRVAYSPDAAGGLGGFMVTWHEGDSPSGGNAVHAMPVSLTGCLGPNRIISAGDSTWWEGGPAIAYSTGSQRFLVAWRAIASTNGSPNDISGRLLDLSGQPLGAAPLKITDSAIYEDNPSVAYNPTTNEFLVAFAGYDSSAFVAARRVTPGGALGAQYELGRSGGTYITDTVYISATGRFFTAWHQLPGGATGRLVNGTSGVPEGDPIPLSVRFTASDALSVAYNELSGSSFLVSHDQFSSEDGGLEISAAGVPSPGFGATNIGGSGNFYPRIAASSADKRWMLVTSNVFQRIHGQFISTSSSGGGTPPPAPPAPPAPPVAPAPLQVTALTPSVATPIAEGSYITWTAATSGGTGTVEYQFVRYSESVGWSIARPYSSNNAYTWFPPAGTNALQVWVRNVGSSAPYDAYQGTGYFNVSPSYPKLTSLLADVAFPAVHKTPITFTAKATGGPGPLQYKFLMYSPSTGWKVGRDYSPADTFTWFPPEGLNAVQVWLRAANSSEDYQDWTTTGLFSVAASASKLVGFEANVPFPNLTSTTITWTAFAVGGTPEYRFVRYDKGADTWSVLREWGPGNQVSWTPGAANSGWHVVQVWVRNAGSQAQYEDWRGSDYFLITNSSGLTMTANRALTGLSVGQWIQWTAAVQSNTGPWEYQFVTYDPFNGWRILQPYSNQDNFTWYPPGGTCAMQVWIRAVGSHAPWERYAASGYFFVSP